MAQISAKMASLTHCGQAIHHLGEVANGFVKQRISADLDPPSPIRLEFVCAFGEFVFLWGEVTDPVP
jgi:hypothetical protein